MGAQKGSNGIRDVKGNVEAFLDWVEHIEDFKPFIHQGILSISRVAKECGLNRDVFYSNPEIRAEGIRSGRVIFANFSSRMPVRISKNSDALPFSRHKNLLGTQQ